jgi:hypothetical protein
VGKRKHKVAFTKDVSKFYQFIEADETLLHVYRVLWRFGDTSQQADMSIIT